VEAIIWVNFSSLCCPPMVDLLPSIYTRHHNLLTMVKKNSKINIFLSMLIFLVIGILIGSNLPAEIIQLENEAPQTFYSTTVKVPAIDQKGEGIIAVLKTEAWEGSGKTLTDIDKLFFWIDTQESIQTAKEVAAKITNKNIDNVDMVYSLEEGKTAIVGGPSAGAAITLATISVLEQKQLREDVMITGTIEDDGSIGSVGSVYEKAVAAKENGAKLFLVPKNSSIDISTRPIKTCEDKDGIEYCETIYDEKETDIGKEIDIMLLEVSNVNEAMDYMIIP